MRWLGGGYEGCLKKKGCVYLHHHQRNNKGKKRKKVVDYSGKHLGSCDQSRPVCSRPVLCPPADLLFFILPMDLCRSDWWMGRMTSSSSETLRNRKQWKHQGTAMMSQSAPKIRYKVRTRGQLKDTRCQLLPLTPVSFLWTLPAIIAIYRQERAPFRWVTNS